MLFPVLTSQGSNTGHGQIWLQLRAMPYNQSSEHSGYLLTADYHWLTPKLQNVLIPRSYLLSLSRGIGLDHLWYQVLLFLLKEICSNAESLKKDSNFLKGIWKERVWESSDWILGILKGWGLSETSNLHLHQVKIFIDYDIYDKKKRLSLNRPGSTAVFPEII